MNFIYDDRKNLILLRERKISFETIIDAVKKDVLDIFENPNHPNQKLIIVDIDNYAWVVPCKILKNKISLITAYPSRKYTKKYLGGKDE